jgi:hypothetical protein
VRSAFAAAAIAAVLAGCGDGNGSSVEGPVTVYASLPLTGPRADAGKAVAEGARLALETAGGKAAGVEVRLEVLDDARGAPWSPAAVGDNARAAAQDSSTAAYIGELDSEPTRVSLPITNDAEILQISPGAGGVDLIAPAQGYPDSPQRYRPSGEVTFARLVAADDEAAAAAARLAIDSGLAQVSLPAPQTSYEKLVTAAFETAAAEVGLETGQTARADAELQIDPDGGFTLLPTGRGPALAVRQQLAPRPDAKSSLRVLLTDHSEESASYAVYGYEAMELVLEAIGKAAEDEGDDEFRRRVTDAVLGAQRPDSTLGPYSIGDDGEPTLCVQPYRDDRPREPICPGG